LETTHDLLLAVLKEGPVSTYGYLRQLRNSPATWAGCHEHEISRKCRHGSGPYTVPTPRMPTSPTAKKPCPYCGEEICGCPGCAQTARKLLRGYRKKDDLGGVVRDVREWAWEKGVAWEPLTKRRRSFRNTAGADRIHGGCQIMGWQQSGRRHESRAASDSLGPLKPSAGRAGKCGAAMSDAMNKAIHTALLKWSNAIPRGLGRRCSIGVRCRR